MQPGADRVRCGGLEEASLPKLKRKKKDFTSPPFYRCQRIVNTLKKADTPQEYRRRILVKMYAQLWSVTLLLCIK